MAGFMQRAAARLAEARGGLPQKLGQLMAFDGMGAGAASAWAGLSEGGPKLSGRRARQLTEQRLGRPLGRIFGAFEGRGCAASMAQVHRAWLRDGRQVAVKLLLPGLRQRIDAGGAFSRYLLGRLQGRARGYDMLAMEGEIHRLSLAECDLEAEAAWLRHFEAWQASFPWFEIPVPIPHACGPETLTMTWLEGARLHEAAAWTRAERALAGARLLRLFLEGALVDGALHADPNPGNLRLRRLGGGDVAVGLLDFGCVLRLPQGFSGALAGLLEALRDGGLDPELALRTLQGLGFDRAPLEAAKERLPQALAVLFEPFLVEGAYDPRGWDLRRRFLLVMGPHAQAFRAAAPAALLYFVRAYAGLVAQVQALDARFHWQAPLAEALASARRQRVARPELPRTPVHGAAASTWLRIEVQKAGSVAVDLSFPAACAGHLGELMPLDLAARIAERGEDLGEHSRRASASGFAPGELYLLKDPDQTVRIWLE
jgi:predicted unusual protein kinase regulating ubiquinone biosynthesis (AarF/ABC1/UbiB family)